MASLDSLPADQRAVLQLVLQRGRTYDDIAQLLSIDRAGVRERALKAFDAIGPQTRVAPERRALITDYLLGQLPGRVAEDTRSRLAQSASERAWARVISSEVAPLAASPLPEIPVEAPGGRGPEPEPRPGRAALPREPRPTPRVPRPTPSEPRVPASYGIPEPEPSGSRPSSRRGGAILLALGALVAIVVVLVLILSGGSSKNSSSTTQASASSSSGTASSSATTSTSTTGTGATPVAQINLGAGPAGAKAAGVALVVRQASQIAIVIKAAHVPPNTAHNAYAVWLYNSASDSHLLGFVNPGVKASGQLTTAGALPANASHYKELLVTLETVATPRTPGPIVLQGQLTGVP